MIGVSSFCGTRFRYTFDATVAYGNGGPGAMTEREMRILFGETLPAAFPADSSDGTKETECSIPQETPPLFLREKTSPSAPSETAPPPPLPVLAEVTREEERLLLETSSRSRSNERDNAFLQRLLALSELFSGTSPAGMRNRR
jgi:hypothetical protein